MCPNCTSLDNRNLFQEELKELSWLTEDMAALYIENSSLIEKIKSLNLELDEFTVNENDDASDNAVEELTTDDYDEKVGWLSREDVIREQLVQQLIDLSQSLSDLWKLPLQPQYLPCISRHMWGHTTLARSPLPPRPRRASASPRRSRQEKLQRWLNKMMPVNLIDLT